MSSQKKKTDQGAVFILMAHEQLSIDVPSHPSLVNTDHVDSIWWTDRLSKTLILYVMRATKKLS